MSLAPAGALIIVATGVTWSDVTAEQVTAAATTAQAIGVLLALLFARRQLAEARTLREEQTRPQVVVDLDTERDFRFPFLVVENVGQTVATDVHFEVDPPLVSTIYEPVTAIGEIGFLKNGIPTLPPGRRITTLFEHAPDRRKNGALPTRHTVTVSYRSPVGGPYSSTYVLDVSTYENIRIVGRKKLHDLAGSVDQIAKLLNRWNTTGALHIRTDDDVKRRYEEWQASLRDDEQELESESEETGEPEEAGPLEPE